MLWHPGLYAEGLVAWARGDDGIDAQAAAFRVAHTLSLVERALAPKGYRG
jgi:hypothetical protein